MNGFACLLILSVPAVEYGWQQGVDGKVEYIVQVEPELLASLQSGEPLVSEIPREIQPVDRIVIRVGRGPLPRQPITRASELGAPPSNPAAGIGGTFGVTAPQTPGAPGFDPDAFRRNLAGGNNGGFQAPATNPATPTQPGGFSPTPIAPVGAPPGNTTPANTGAGGFTIQPPPRLNSNPGFNGNITTAINAFTPGADDSFPLDVPPPPDEPPTETNPGGVQPLPNTDPAFQPGTFQPGTFQPGTFQPGVAPPNTQPNFGADNGVGATREPEFRRAPFPAVRSTPTQFASNQGVGGVIPIGANPPPQSGQPGAMQSPVNSPINSRFNPAPIPPGYNGYTAAVPGLRNAPTAPNLNHVAQNPPTLDKNTALKAISETEEEKPWWALTLVSMFLFASIGLNCYLGWVSRGIYHRFRRLAADMRDAEFV